MTLKKIAVYTIALGLSASFFACNSEYAPAEETATCAAVRSFSIADNDSILANLDSVFFTIDLVKGEIYNADSLPKGTRVTGLVPVIATYEGASLIELKVKRATGADTTYNYGENSTAAMDFTNPVTLHVISPDGRTERNYTIKVNVHQEVPDSLYWNEEARTTLPTTFSAPSAQKTVRNSENIYCLTQQGNDFCLATHQGDIVAVDGAFINLSGWTYLTVNFGFSPQIASLTATSDALYILSTLGDLYKSINGGISWSRTGANWHHIYGGYAEEVIGSTNTASGWMIESYPSRKTSALPKGMPVEGSSMPVEYAFSMSANPQMLIVGGKCADGTLSGHTWGFDGSSWACISKKPISPLKDVTVAPYFAFTTSVAWISTEYPTMMAIGGCDADGVPGKTVFVSNDYGYHWKEAPRTLMLPDYIPAFSGAQALVMSGVYNNKRRISRPIENWDCPFIYLFGGNLADGSLSNTIWRGAINRMTFKPIE